MLTQFMRLQLNSSCTPWIQAYDAIAQALQVVEDALCTMQHASHERQQGMAINTLALHETDIFGSCFTSCSFRVLDGMAIVRNR